MSRGAVGSPYAEEFIHSASTLNISEKVGFLQIGVYHPHLKGISNALKQIQLNGGGVYHPHLKGISNHDADVRELVLGVYHPHLKGISNGLNPAI